MLITTKSQLILESKRYVHTVQRSISGRDSQSIASILAEMRRHIRANGLEGNREEDILGVYFINENRNNVRHEDGTILNH